MADRPTFRDKVAPNGPKRLLALDGGGILGAISIEYLVRIEDLLREGLKRDESFVLADYFDYVGGTSTGAIIATCIALGMSAREVRQFYHTRGAEMFDRAFVLRRLRYKYSDRKLAELLQATIDQITGEKNTKFGSERLRTLLMVVLRNATTDSPWPLSNNPNAKYNDRQRPDCNLELPLWQIVRASTAAPTYFPPEVVAVGSQAFVFVDGGVTVFNNPALQLFLMATVDAYRLNWPAGADKMLLVSIGTGATPDANPELQAGDMNLLYNATRIPSALMAAASAQQDMVCRVLGRCVHGAPLDREVGDLLTPDLTGADPCPALAGPLGKGKLFTYARYNVDLTPAGLEALNLSDIRVEDVQEMDSVDHIPDLARVGEVAAGRDVKAKHFQGFL
jgi:uncharacterized protein